MKTRLAAALKLWLQNQRLNQKQLAKAWKCSESTVTRFLAGTAMPEATTLLRIFQWCLDAEPINTPRQVKWLNKIADAETAAEVD